MGICLISDVHGSKNWREIIKEKDKFNRIIFVGDYFDTYFPNKITRKDEIDNFREIIKFKKENKEKVELLVGNHDINQYILNEEMSRKAFKEFEIIKSEIEKNIDLFKVVTEAKDEQNRKWVISHAGISKTWMKNQGFDNIEQINKSFYEKKYEIFKWCGMDIYGGNVTQSPMWIRPESLITDMYAPFQIVGHTRFKERPYIIKENVNGVEQGILCIDGMECAVIGCGDME